MDNVLFTLIQYAEIIQYLLCTVPVSGESRETKNILV